MGFPSHTLPPGAVENRERQARIASLTELRDRVRDAEGPSYDLEQAIGRTLRPEAVGVIYPAYTASIDAALRLVDQLLPGAEWEVSTLGGEAWVKLPLNGECDEVRRWDGHVALAVVEALLSVLAVTGKQT